MRFRPLGLALAALLAVSPGTRADTIVLKDGSILGGVVKQVKDGYEITTPDGKTTFVKSDQVKSIKLSNDGKVTEQNAKERLASLRRSVESESQIDRIIDRYHQFIEMNKEADASDEAAKDLAMWESRKAQNMVKVGSEWMTPERRDAYLLESARLANAVADQIAAGDIAGATPRVAQALEANPSHVSFAYLDGVLNLRRARFNEAKRSFDIVSEQIPDHPPTLFNEAAIAVYFKRWPNAVAMFEKAMTLAPNQPEILNGVIEFMRLAPDATRRTVAFDRMQAIFNSQEAQIEAEMAQKGLHRFGSGFADQAQIDEMNQKLAAFEEKKKVMQADYDAIQQRIKDLQQRVEAVERQLAQMDSERIQPDGKGGTIFLPRPQYYYDLQANRERYIHEMGAEKVKSDDLKKEAKQLESQAPQPPFAGHVVPIGEAGVPIVLPAGATLEEPKQTTKPADDLTTPREEDSSPRGDSPILTPQLPATQPSTQPAA